MNGRREWHAFMKATPIGMKPVRANLGRHVGAYVMPWGVNLRQLREYFASIAPATFHPWWLA